MLDCRYVLVLGSNHAAKAAASATKEDTFLILDHVAAAHLLNIAIDRSMISLT
jgi:hypothetical protein